MLDCNLVFGLDGMFELQHAVTRGNTRVKTAPMVRAPKVIVIGYASYVWTARSVSNVNVLPLLTWNTYNFMLNLPEFSALARLAHLVI